MEVVVDKEGQLKSVTISGKIGTESGGTLPGSSPLELDALHGKQATVTQTVDMTDPANQELGLRYVEAVATGNFASAAAIQQQLIDNSTVVIHTDTTDFVRAEVDLEVIQGKVEEKRITAEDILLKPPHQTWQRVPTK